MSWLVEDYIINKYRLETSEIPDEDTLDNLYIITSTFKKLFLENKMSEREFLIVEFVSFGYSFLEIAKMLNIYRVTVSRIFRRACEKVAQHLGEYFTDSGLIKYMTETHKLTSEESEKLKEFINQKYSHSLRRKHEFKMYTSPHYK